jgi:hypothetical protein
MRGNGEGIVSALAFEFTPAAIFGSAVAFAGATALALPPLSPAPVAAGGAALGAALIALRWIGSKGRVYAIPRFDAPDFEPQDRIDDIEELVLALAEPGDELEELVLEDVFEVPVSDELVLEDVVETPEDDPRVVQLFQPKETPTAGELHERIERHLRSAPRLVPDATDELREALSALRQSLR